MFCEKFRNNLSEKDFYNIDKDEYDGGNQHSAKGCDDGQHGFPGRGELSVSDFALDLKTDREEENHHKDVVDELLYGHVPREKEVDLTIRT